MAMRNTHKDRSLRVGMSYNIVFICRISHSYKKYNTINKEKKPDI